MFIKYLFLLSAFLQYFKSELIFEDEFDVLNTTNWIILDRKADCERLNPRQMTCDTSNEINLRSIYGTLTLTAIIQSYFDRKFTSATIVTKNTLKFDGFNYLIRIRAALTREPGLLPHVFLIVDPDYNRRVFSSFFTITSRTYNKIWDGNSLAQFENTTLSKTNLDQFQNYDLIITKDSLFIWRLNNKPYYNSTASRGLWGKLIDQPFRLGITLDLDSDYTEKQLDEISFNQWNCPTFMIDSVRIYKSKQFNFELPYQQIKHEKKDIQGICKNISSLEYDSKITPGLIKPLELLWSDEFDNYSKQSNWIIKNSHIECMENNRENDCNFDKNSNIEISNGTLKLYPIDKKLSEPGENSTLHTIGLVIASVPCFKNVRVEIRAKRPMGLELTAKLYMQAYEGHCNSDSVKGSLDIAKIRDTDESFWDLQTEDQISVYTRDTYKKQFRAGTAALFYKHVFFVSSINLTSSSQHSNYHYTIDKLDDFQNYGIEWNDFGIQWLFNGRVIYQANQKLDQYGRFMTENSDNIDDYYLPFKQPFNILIKILAHDYETDKETELPVFEIDYVRVYGNQLIGSEIIDFRDADKLTEQNITEILAEKRPPYLLIGASSLIFIVLVILVIALVFALLKIKNINKNKEENEENKGKGKDFGEQEVYDDIIIGLDNIYDDPDQLYTSISNENVYSNPYENSPNKEKQRKYRYLEILPNEYSIEDFDDGYIKMHNTTQID